MYEDFFINRLIQLRGEKDVSARDMSLSIGQSVNYINSVENRIYLPSMSVFFYICEYLGITPSEFFNDKDKYPILVQEILDNLFSLNEAQLRAILAVSKEMKGSN